MSAPQIDMQRIPRHIAIIMDGNGRWAVRRGLPRTAGHQEGVETVKRITEEAVRLGVKYLTLYTFSTETGNVRAMKWLHSCRLYLHRFRKSFSCATACASAL